MMEDNNIQFYSVGIVAMSACAPNYVTTEELEEQANLVNPTGIRSKWKVSNENFQDGKSNPCVCNIEPDKRKHYLLNC